LIVNEQALNNETIFILLKRTKDGEPTLTTEEFYFGFPIKIKWEYFASFLKFMNPLRYFETENLFKLTEDKKLPATLNNLSYLWDFLGRIFVTYGYYQTIQAFRKFGRK
jgi:hypothetical protein